VVRFTEPRQKGEHVVRQQGREEKKKEEEHGGKPAFPSLVVGS